MVFSHIIFNFHSTPFETMFFIVIKLFIILKYPFQSNCINTMWFTFFTMDRRLSALATAGHTTRVPDGIEPDTYGFRSALLTIEIRS
jgi:hypothetical protein